MRGKCGAWVKLTWVRDHSVSDPDIVKNCVPGFGLHAANLQEVESQIA